MDPLLAHTVFAIATSNLMCKHKGSPSPVYMHLLISIHRVNLHLFIDNYLLFV